MSVKINIRFILDNQFFTKSKRYYYINDSFNKKLVIDNLKNHLILFSMEE